MVEITLSRKQQQAIELLDDPTVTELLYGGSAGAGKSWLVCLWAVIQCRQYPGITIGLCRKEITNLRKTTAQTLLTEVQKTLGVTDKDLRYSSLVDPGCLLRQRQLNRLHRPGSTTCRPRTSTASARSA